MNFRLLFSLVVLVAAQQAGAEVDRAGIALTHPIILGASVSSGLMVRSPGDRASGRFTAPGNITNLAESGRAGRDYGNIDAAFVSRFSSVIAVDILFWDSTGGDQQKSLRALRNLIIASSQAERPLVLGDIPHLLDSQITRDALNWQIHTMCKPQRRCYVLPLSHLHDVANTDGVVIGGYRYFYSSLTVDGMHLNDVGSEYVAGMIINVLRGARE